MFLKLYFYSYRIIIFFFIFLKVLGYGIFHPRVLFNFLFSMVSEIAEFHKRCGGNIKNFKETDLYQNIVRAMIFPRSNYFNIIPGSLRPAEAQVMGTLVEFLKPKIIFEFGTYNGFSTLHMARNTPKEALVYTLDLPQDDTLNEQRHDLREAYGDIQFIKKNAMTWFDQDEAKQKIVKLSGDSRTFDFSRYYGQIDFIFIDANHSYDYVKSDSENAFKMLSPRGVLLWHDYDFIHPGIFHFLNELARIKRIYYVEHTRLVLFMNG